MLKAESRESKRLGDKVLDIIALRRWLVPLSIIIFYFILFSIIFPKTFLSAYNITSMLLEFSIPTSFVIVSIATMLISGEIDLSVGYAVTLSNVMAGYLVALDMPLAVCILVPIAVMTLFGFLNGLLVVRVGVNSFITTLGAGMVFYGLTLVINGLGNALEGATLIQHLPDWFTKISQTSLLVFPDGGSIQMPVLYSAVILITFTILFAKSRYFKKYYYIGTNSEAAMLSGINVKSMKTLAFTLSSALAGTAGVLMAARMGAATTQLGAGLELKAITACVIGGVSFKGGVGTMGGAILGGFFMICLSNALRLSYAPSNIYKIIEGIVLAATVILDAKISKRKIVG